MQIPIEVNGKGKVQSEVSAESTSEKDNSFAFSSVQSNYLFILCCVFRPALVCLQHLKAGRKTQQFSHFRFFLPLESHKQMTTLQVIPGAYINKVFVCKSNDMH